MAISMGEITTRRKGAGRPRSLGSIRLRGYARETSAVGGLRLRIYVPVRTMMYKFSRVSPR